MSTIRTGLTAKLPELIMKIQPRIIEHLGINMYTSLPPVISELVANAWDADAPNVWITFSTEKINKDTEIVVRDDGSGMTHQEIMDKYLIVARNRRRISTIEENYNEITPIFHRRVLGRKGIGKLSIFGVAKKIVVKTVRDRKLTEFEMDLDKIIAEESGIYRPIPIRLNIDTTEKNGTTVTLKNLKRIKPISSDLIIKGLARRFTLLGKNFQVHVNDHVIGPDDRKIENIVWTWPIDESIPDHPDWKLKGKIMTLSKTVRHEENRGIAIFAHGKLAQEPTFFEQTSGKELAYDYMIGEIEADFLDEKNDVISSNRSSINWESAEGEALKEWGAKKVYDISHEWNKRRLEEKTKAVTDNPIFQAALMKLDKGKRKKAIKVISTFVGDEEMSKEKSLNMANFVLDIFAYDEFQELVNKIGKTEPENHLLLTELFNDWEHLEAKEMGTIMEGRLSTLKKLDWNINKTEKSETVDQYIKRFPWIIDQKWTSVQNENKYSNLLKKEFSDNIKDHRIDFLCFKSWPNLVLVELKTPDFVVDENSLNQLQKYVDFLGESVKKSDSELTIIGYLVCGKMKDTIEFNRKVSKSMNDGIYIKKYSVLLKNADQMHMELYEKYKKLGEDIQD